MEIKPKSGIYICRMFHVIEAWDKVLSIEYISWCKEVIKIKRLLFPSELCLDSYPTKYQSDWMCGIYSRRSACLSYNICMSVCTNVCLCIDLTSTSSLGGGDV